MGGRVPLGHLIQRGGSLILLHGGRLLVRGDGGFHLGGGGIAS